MKLILLLVTTLLLNIGYGDLFSLPDQAFSVNVATGKWVESASEGETRRIWDGENWQWMGDKKSSQYHFTDKKLTKVTPPGKAPIQYFYDKKGRITKRLEGDSRFIEISYDTKGRVIEERSPLGRDSTPYPYARFVYKNSETEVYDALGTKKIYKYNSDNEIVEIKHFSENGLYKIERFKWESGRLKKQILENARGEEIYTQKNIWDSSGKLVQQIITGNLTGRRPLDTFTQSLIYNKEGQVDKIDLGDGTEIKAPLPETAKPDKTVYQYNQYHQLITKTFPNGEIESYEWDLFGNLAARTTTKEGKQERFTYDFMNRLIRESEGFSFEYDLCGRQTKQTDPEGNETLFSYDAFGRMTEKLDPEVLDPRGQVIRPTTRWIYNEMDQVIETIDPDGWSTKTSYTVRGQPTRIEYPDGRVEEQFYQVNGQEEKKENAPPASPPLEELSPVEKEGESTPVPPPEQPEDPSLIEKVFNERGQKVVQKTFTDFIGIRSVRTYDALGRLEKVEKYDIAGRHFLTKEMRYTPAGIKAVEITNGEITEWTWGPFERLDEVVQFKGTAKEKRTRLIYDQKGKLSHFIKPSGLTLAYAYDETGGLQSLVSSDGSVNYALIWGQEGRLNETIDLNTGKKTSREYDEKGQLIKEVLANGLTMKWEESATVLPDESRIRYIRDDKRILKQISRENADGETLYTHTYSHFDAWDLLVEEEMILGMGKVVYGRDKEQRITSIVSPYREEKLSYDGLQLKEIETDGVKKIFEYDDQFRLIKEAVPGSIEFDRDGNTIKSGTHTLKYDALDRLVTVDGIIHYEYDSFGRRISATYPEGKRLFFWDGMEEIGVATPDAQIQELKVMGSHGPAAVELDGYAFPALLDAKGSIASLATLSGDYESPWTYQGKRKDAETGFIYFGARFLDPARGQFLTPDPKGFADGQDLYHFAKYNPNAFSDTWGHTAIMDGFKSLAKTGLNALLRIHQTMSEWRSWVNNLTGLQSIQNKMEDAAYALFGQGFLTQVGYYQQEIQSGVFGEKEIDPLVRVTFNHGILNIRSDLIENLRQISTSHGNVNVHYVYRPTNGFAWDILKCGFVKMGYLSQEARELLRIWKGLIEEMGGAQAGGKVIHYTHSIGSADTRAALAYLSIEEQKMFDIRTFGSATIIPDVGSYKVINYVSRGDFITLIGEAISYFPARFRGNPHVVFVGNFFETGFEHTFCSDSYKEVVIALGQAFLEAYSG